MKKIISTILCISLLSSIICIPVSATDEIYLNANESITLDEFSDELNEMIEDNTALYEDVSEETTDNIAVSHMV